MSPSKMLRLATMTALRAGLPAGTMIRDSRMAAVGAEGLAAIPAVVGVFSAGHKDSPAAPRARQFDRTETLIVQAFVGVPHDQDLPEEQRNPEALDELLAERMDDVADAIECALLAGVWLADRKFNVGAVDVDKGRSEEKGPRYGIVVVTVPVPVLGVRFVPDAPAGRHVLHVDTDTKGRTPEQHAEQEFRATPPGT